MKRILGALLLVALAGLVAGPADGAEKKLTLSGVVRSSDQIPIADVSVCATVAGTDFESTCDSTDASGRYQVRLLPYDYDVTAVDGSDDRDWVQTERGRRIHVKASRHLDLTMIHGGRIQGFVRVPDGAEPIGQPDQVHVDAYPVDGATDVAGYRWERSGYVYPSSFRIKHLTPGTYKLRVVAYGRAHRFAEQWYPDQGLSSRGAVVAVRSGETVEIEPMTLVTAGSLTMTLREGARPVKGSAEVFDADGRAMGYNVEQYADKAGTFTIPGLFPGQYRVHAFHDRTWFEEWFEHHTTARAATPITVTSGEETRRTMTFRVKTVRNTKPPRLTVTRSTVLHATTGRWSVRPTQVRYRWYRDGHRVNGWKSTYRTKKGYRAGSTFQVCVDASTRRTYAGHACSRRVRLPD